MSDSIIRKYRSYLMGIAIILIMIYHMTESGNTTWNSIKGYGDFGVNIFYFVSGFGIYYAWRKNQDTVMFYFRRFIRVGVIALPVTFVWCLPQVITGRISLAEFVIKLTTLQFWVDGNLLHWYISGLVFFYLITPLWMRWFDREKRRTLWVTAVCLISIIVFSRIFSVLYKYILFIDRAPCYFIGLMIGERSKSNLGMKKVELGAITGMGLVGIGLNLRLGKVHIYGKISCLLIMDVTSDTLIMLVTKRGISLKEKQDAYCVGTDYFGDLFAT